MLLWHPKFWAEPGGEFVRLVGQEISGAHLAAGRAAEKFKLTTAEEPLIVMRVPSVAQAITAQYGALLWAARWPFGGWAFLILAAATVIQLRGRR